MCACTHTHTLTHAHTHTTTLTAGIGDHELFRGILIAAVEAILQAHVRGFYSHPVTSAFQVGPPVAEKFNSADGQALLAAALARSDVGAQPHDMVPGRTEPVEAVQQDGQDVVAGH
jgi:hypothetical protein